MKLAGGWRLGICKIFEITKSKNVHNFVGFLEFWRSWYFAFEIYWPLAVFIARTDRMLQVRGGTPKTAISGDKYDTFDSPDCMYYIVCNMHMYLVSHGWLRYT